MTNGLTEDSGQTDTRRQHIPREHCVARYKPIKTEDLILF